LPEPRDHSWTIFWIGIPIAVLVTICGGVLASLLFVPIARNLPPTAQAVPNYKEQRFEVETTNPATRAYRVTSVAFQIREMIPPPLPKGAIEIKTVYFLPEDYDAKTSTYKKDLFDVEMPANGNLNLRFFIIDPKYKDYIFRGMLTIFYDDRNNPGSLELPDYGIVVQASK